MTYSSEQDMLMRFLNIDYDKSWEQVEYETGYNFGDFCFKKMTPDEIMPIIRMMWASLHGRGLRKS